MPSANVHFRNLTATHVDDDHDGCGQHTGPLRQGSPHVFVQNRPLVREKDLPSCAGRPDHEPAAHCHVGEGGGSAITTARRGGVQSAPRKKCTSAGHPVDVATGRVFTHVTERGSPALPGFVWERFYSTELAAEPGPLGWGWAHSLMQRLELGPDEIAYVDAEGRRVLFPRLDLGESVQHLDEQVTLAQGNEGEYVLERPEGISLFFEADPEHSTAQLQAVFDEGEQFLVLEYDQMLLRRVTDSLGSVYRIDTEDGLHWSSISREATQEEPEHCLARFQFDRAGCLSAAADALGEWWRYGYDFAHRLVQETNRSGYTFFFEYDGQGRCLRTHGQDGLYDLSFSYAEGQTTQRDSDGDVTAYDYSDLGLVTRVTKANGHSEEFTYADANQIAHTDALGRTTAYAYDPEGRVTERTAPSGATARMAYDGDGLTSLAEPDGEPLTRTVTPEGQVSVSAASVPLLTLEADPEDGSLSVAGGDGEKSRLYFDDAGRQAAAVSPLGRTLETAYDSFGSVAALRDTAGRTVRFEYDAEGRLSAVDRDGGSGRGDKGSGFRFGYDPEGNLAYFVDGNDGVTRFGTGSFNQLQSLTLPDGRIARFEYDDANRLHRLFDARQSSWQMDYDWAGRLERLLHPDGGSETFSYDPAGQVRRHTARSGAGKEYEYDADGSLTQIRCDDGAALQFVYDKNGRVTGASGPGTEVQFEYDGLGRLVREAQNGQSVAYTYDAAGRLSGIETPTGDQLAYGYDADGMLTEASDWNGGQHSFVYAADGTLQSLHAPNGVSSRFEYSPLGLPTLVHLERAGEAAPLAQIRLRFDGSDALTEAADSALGRARFEYDPAGRLVRASGETRETFEYDPAGNLLRQGRQEYAYSAGNERVSSPDFACRYDAGGNLVEEDTPAGTRRCTYNALGLLTQAEMPGGVRAEYAYDPFGRRLVKRVHQAGRAGRFAETRFVWAGDLLLSETTTDETGTTTETRDFFFLPGSFTPLAQRVSNAAFSGAVFCCHTDFRGAPTRLTDADAQVAWAAAYSAYGRAYPRKERLRQPLRLPGQYHDEETGLHQNRWRSFDPETGRYLSPDPLGLAGGLNVYAYAQQDPVNSADPLGLFPGLSDLTGHLLPPQAMQGLRQLRQTVSQGVLNHLGPLRSLLPPANPRPPDPAMSLVHPKQHLPPLPAQATPPAHHQSPAHQSPAHHASVHHASAPAKAAAHCAPAPHAAAPASHAAAPHPPASHPAATHPPAAAPAHTVSGFLHNVPGSLKGVGTGVIGLPKMLWHTGNDIGTSLSDGVDAAYNRAFGDKDIADADDKEAAQADARTREKLLNLVPFGGSHGGIAHYAEAAGDWAASLSLPSDQAAAMRQEGGAALHRANGYMEDMAYKDPAGFALNVLPLAAVGRAAALGRLGKLADGAEAAEREAAAAGNAEQAARLSQKAAGYRQSIHLLRGGKAGAALREAKAKATSNLSAKAKTTVAKAKAAAAKRRAAKANARRMASPAKLREKWDKQGSGGGGHGTPALAGVSGGERGGTAAIGKPESKSGGMQMAAHGPGHTPVPHGRVAAPGGRMADYKTYDTDAKVPAHYRTDPKKFTELSEDPAHGNAVDARGRQEAMAGLEAQHQKLVPGPLTRGPKEIEFYDAHGNPWDVKAPPSIKFQPQTIGQSIKKQLTKPILPGIPPGTFPNKLTSVPTPVGVILDSSYMNAADHAALWTWLNTNLTAPELSQVVEINTRP